MCTVLGHESGWIRYGTLPGRLRTCVLGCDKYFDVYSTEHESGCTPYGTLLEDF